MPRTSSAIAHRKYQLALDLIRENQGMTTKHIQKQMKKTFGHNFSTKKIAEARLQVMKEREGKQAIIGMERAGRASRLKETARHPGTLSASTVDTELMMEHNMRDITGIIMKRFPGLKKFHLDVNAAGEPVVTYKVTTDLIGTLKT